MALHLGGDKLKINANGSVCSLIVYTAEQILNGIKLLSSENYVLKDSSGLYLTAKESE